MAVRRDQIQLDVLINGVKAGATLKELRRDARVLELEISQLSATDGEALIAKQAELKKINDVLATARSRVRGVDLALQDSGKSGGFFANSLKAAGAALIGFFAIQRVQQWGRELLAWLTRGSAALEAMQKKTAIVFGDAISIVRDFARINSDALGVTEEQYSSLAATIGDILIPMGFQREEAAKLSTQLTNLSGALSEWSNGQRTAEEVNKILAKAITGERESLKELGIVILETDVQQRLLEKGQKNLTGTALQQAKALANVELIMERSKDAQTAFLTNQENIARSGARISAALANWKESLLRDIIPAMQSFGSIIADVVSPLKQQSDLLGALQSQFNIQIETLQRANLSQDNRKKLIDAINAKYKEYLPNLITEKTTLAELRDIQNQVNDTLRQRIITLSAQEALQEVNTAKLKNEADLYALELQRTEANKKLNDELTKRGVITKEVGFRGTVRTEFVKDDNFVQAFESQAVQSAATEAQQIEEQINRILQSNEKLNERLKFTEEAARRVGVDIDAILNPSGGASGTPTDPGTSDGGKRAFEQEQERIELLKQQRIRALDFLVLTEEQKAAQRKVIELEAENEIGKARINIFQKSSEEKLRLSESEVLAIQQQISDKEVEIIRIRADQELALTRDQIETIRQLKIQELDRDLLSEQEYADQLKVINAQATLDIARIRQNQPGLSTAERLKAEQEVADAEVALQKASIEAVVNAKVEQLEKSRSLALAAAAQAGLDEEDLQKTRELINLEADIRILDARKALYAQNTAELAELERQLAEARARLGGITFSVNVEEGGSSNGTEHLEEELARKAEIERAGKQAAIDFSRKLTQQEFQEQRDRVDRQLEHQLNAISKEYDARIAAAKGNSALEQRLIAEKEKKEKEARKDAAREKKRIAIREALIQGAISLIEAAPNPALMALSAFTTGLSIALIEAQSFKKGGGTGNKALYKDAQGHGVAGVVHVNEWVAPEDMVQDPVTGPVIARLEQIRRKRGGFVSGGFTSDPTITLTRSSFVDNTPVGVRDVDLRQAPGAAFGAELLQEIRALRADQVMLARELSQLKLRAYVVYEDVEDAERELEGIRRRSAI